MTSQRHWGMRARPWGMAGILLAVVIAPRTVQAQGKSEPNAARQSATSREKQGEQFAALKKAGQVEQAVAAAEKCAQLDRDALQGVLRDDPQNKQEIIARSQWVIQSHQFLGERYSEREDFAQAKTAFEEVLASQLRIHGAAHYRVADARRELEHLEILKKLTSAERGQLRHAERLDSQYQSLFGNGRFREALPVLREILAIEKEVLGEKHHYTAGSLSKLGTLLRSMGDYAGARPYMEQALAAKREVLGNKHPSTATSLDNLGILLFSMEDYAGARPYYEQALAIREEIHGEKHSDTATSLNNLGSLHHYMGDYAAAQPYYERALAIYMEVLGEKHAHTATSLDNLSGLYLSMGDNARALTYAERALAIRKEVLGEKHPSTAGSLNNVGYTLRSMDDYAGARPYYEQSLAILREMLGEKHPDTATAFGNLGRLHQDMGDYAGARPYYEKSLAIYRAAIGEKHPSTASSLNSIGMLLYDMGDYAGARPYLEQALEISQEVLGEKHPGTARSLNDLGMLLSSMGDYAGARDYYERALVVRKEALGGKHHQTAASLNNLGTLLQSRGDYQGARPYLEQALAIVKETLGEKHSLTAAAHNNLGMLLHAVRDYSGALPYAEQALTIRKEVLGEKHPDTAASYGNVGLVLGSMGDNAGARPYLERALAIRKEVLGEKHPETALALDNLGECLVAEGQWQRAGEMTDQARQVMRQHVAKVLPGLSEKEQLQFLRRHDEHHFHGALSVGFSGKNEGTLKDLSASWLLNGKAVAHESLAERARNARVSRDPALAAMLGQLQSVRQQLARAINQGPGKNLEIYRKQLVQLEAQEQQLSRQLGQAQRQQVRDDPWVSLIEVRQLLPDRSVLVEIVRFQVWNLKERRWSWPRYAAWLIPPAGEGAVEIIDLGEAAAIEAGVADFQKEIRTAGKQIYQEGEADAEALLRKKLDVLSRRILAPLLPRIGKTPRWLISADAALWLVPWGALTLENGQYALERHQISYLTSGRDLVTQPAQVRPAANSLVVADPDFNLDSGGATSDRAGTRGDSRTSRSGVSFEWPRLAGTALEAKALVPHLTAYLKRTPEVYLGAKAVEGVVKRAERPRLAVLSTHGFFLEDQEVSPEERERLSLGGSQSTPPATNLENPLLRCGLVFSGANRRGQLPAGADDGILTGLEIVGADLRGTELVVLSACETGLGKVNNGEGVAGLRQAFQLAGAEAVASTLWKIPDWQTEELMTVFWQELAKGTNKADALRNAQLSVIQAHRAKDKAAHPFFWAAFTLTGQIRFPDSPVVTPPSSSFQIEITAATANVMGGSVAVAIANRGQRYQVEGTNGLWYKITVKTPQGPRTGWVHQNQVKRAE